MKITKKQYDEAVAKLPKFQKAQEIVKNWEAGLASRPEIDPADIIAVEVTPFGPAVTCKPKEKKDAQRIPAA